MEFKDLLGKILTNVENKGDEVIFTVSDSEQYKLYHDQDCCESVSVDDVVGDSSDLIGSPITLAEEAVSTDNPKLSCEWPDEDEPEGMYRSYDESCTWTFYKLATVKGYVDIKWYGSSNGYYSEGVSFCKVGEEREY